MFFGPRVPRHERSHIQNSMGIHATNQLGDYLSVPLCIDRINQRTCHFIIQKIKHKLEGWQVKHLTLAGQCTLVQFVLGSVSNYVMQSAWLPTSTRALLNCINCDF